MRHDVYCGLCGGYHTRLRIIVTSVIYLLLMPVSFFLWLISGGKFPCKW